MIDKTVRSDAVEGGFPDAAEILGRVDVHAGVVVVLTEPSGQGDSEVAIGTFFDEPIQSGLDLNAILGRAAPILDAPDGDQRPLAMRIGRNQMRVRIDANGIVAAGNEAVEDAVPILVAGSGPAPLEPGEVPHGDGERALDLAQPFALICCISLRRNRGDRGGSQKRSSIHGALR